MEEGQRKARGPGNRTKSHLLNAYITNIKPEASVFFKIKHGLHVKVHKFEHKEAREKVLVFGPQL
jgi:hypothetical protein